MTTAALRISVEPFDGPVARPLVAALMADLEERYAADGPGDGDHPELVALHRVRSEQVTPPAGVFLVAWHDGEPAGCGAVRRLIGGPPDVGEVKRMYTVPTARRLGISRALLARLELDAAGLGMRRLQLETGVRQPEAISLYEADGYHRIPSFGQYAGDDLSVCFAKDLGSAGEGGAGPRRNRPGTPRASALRRTGRQPCGARARPTRAGNPLQPLPSGS